jgi:hypothetical protein
MCGTSTAHAQQQEEHQQGTENTDMNDVGILAYGSLIGDPGNRD